MRLKSVYISHYKNLHDFTLNFDGNSFIDVFVGKNGTGKSNLFEALIEIFRHIFEFDREKEDLDFSYKIQYQINEDEVEIEWSWGEMSHPELKKKIQPRKFYINSKKRKTIGNTPLPNNVLIYYSGHNDTVTGLVEKYETAFRKRIKRSDFDEARYFIGIGPQYKALLLAMSLIQSNTNKARQYICQKLGIETVAKEIRLVLDRPYYATDSRFDIEYNDETDRYWKPEGITKTFLDRLSTCISSASGSSVRSEGYFASEDRYILYFDIAIIQNVFTDLTVQELFRQFDNLKTLGMLTDISIPLQLAGSIDTNITHFSDGQFQTVYIYTIMELFKDRNCITLLDEPDSFLHPEWQFDFLKQVFDITDIAPQKNHVIMSSHSAATLCCLEEQHIRLFHIDNSRVFCSKRTKKEIINELSNSFIQYSEDESKLLIDNVIRSSSRPILFVEGLSDVSILNTAYAKLYPGTDIPVLIQDAFDRGFIKILFARHEIFQTYPDKHFFALFDFDDAYNDWRELGGEHQVTDIGLGLCCKLAEKNAHTFLLPVPDNQLRSQVWDEANPIEKIKCKPHFCIEHIFWGIEGLDRWFRLNDKTGQIRFKDDRHKVKFAKEIVPALDATHFEIFRPIFEFIRSKCPV